MLQTLLNILIETLWLVLFLAIGIGVGYLIFIFVEFIVMKVAHKKRSSFYEMVLVSDVNLTEVKNNLKAEFIDSYGSKNISLRIDGLRKISEKGINLVAKSYYPESKNPMLEITVDNLFILAKDVSGKIDEVLDDILASKSFNLLWKGFATFNNIKNFFKKADKDENLNLDARKQKLTFIASILENKKPKDDTKETKEDKTYFLVNSLINNKLSGLIDYVVDEANSLYAKKIVSAKKVKNNA